MYIYMVIELMDRSSSISFRKLTASLKENIQSDTGCNNSMPMEFEASPDGEVPTKCTDTELSSVIKDLLDLSAGTTRYSSLLKYVHAGEKLYDEACQLEEKVIHFEDKIRRTYFHVKPLDAGQLKNWHSYLDFVEMYGDFDWVWSQIVMMFKPLFSLWLFCFN